MAAAAFVFTVTLTSLWNFYGLSMPVPEPTSDISAYPAPVPPAAIGVPTGVIEWTFDAGEPLTAPATVVAGRVYIVSGASVETGRIAGLSLADGSVNWELRLGSIADFSPVAAGDLVYVGTRAGDLIALNRHTGRRVWISNLGSSVVGSPVVHRGVVYIASEDIYALDAASGAQIWRHAVDGDVTRPIQLSGGIVAAISSDGNVNLVNSKNGRRRLTFPLWFSTSAGPAAVGTTLVIPGDRAFVQALDIVERDIPMEKAVRFWWTKLWLWDMAPRPPLPRGYLWQARGLGGDTAYAIGADDVQVYLSTSSRGRDGRVLNLNIQTGEMVWGRPLGSVVFPAALITDRTVVVGLESGSLVGMDKQTGEVMWEHGLAGGLSAPPVAARDGVILVAGNDGTLRALR